MRLIDAHHHLWIPESRNPDLGYRWLRDIGAVKPFGDPTPIQRNYEWGHYIKDSHQHELAGSVYLQVDGAIASPVAETEWVQEVFSRSSLKHAIVGLADLSASDAQRVIEAQCQFPAFRGIRHIIARLDEQPLRSFAPEHYLRNHQWRDQFQLLSENALSFDLQLYPEQMTEAAEFLAHHPSVPVIIDHAGSPYDQTPEGLISLRQGLASLAELPQVSIKLSGFGMFDTQRSAESVKPVIDSVLSAFDSSRVMYGSNFPVDRLMGSFDDTVQIVQACIESLTDAEQQAIWADNATRVYRL